MLAALLAGCDLGSKEISVKHDAYIWQRKWTSAVSTAARENAERFDRYRVLVLEVMGDDIVATEPDVGALAALEKSVRMVVRIEGSKVPIDAPRLFASLGPRIAAWKTKGLAVRGIEIDHDCASAGLGRYAEWLREIRGLIPMDLELSITALPSWLASPDLPAVLETVDQNVLQLHGVEENRASLFESDRALDWVHRWSAISDKEFFVALPSYAVRVKRDASGHALAVDAEAVAEIRAPVMTELRADPRDVAVLLQAIEKNSPARLAGVVWFRLPVPGDRLGWSITTLDSVITGKHLRSDWRLKARQQEEGSVEVFLSNVGTLDDKPPTIMIPESCPIAGAMGVYQHDPKNLTALEPSEQAWLRARHRMHIAWARCREFVAADWKTL